MFVLLTRNNAPDHSSVCSDCGIGRQFVRMDYVAPTIVAMSINNPMQCQPSRGNSAAI